MQKKELSLQSILDDFPVFEETDRGKLVCTLTKHELPIAEIGKYVKTKKFLEQWGIHDALMKYSEYFQELEKGILACTLTKRSVARSGKALQNHVNGARFVAARAKAEAEKAAAAEANAVSPSSDSAENGDGDVPRKNVTSGSESNDEASSDKEDDDIEMEEEENNEDEMSVEVPAKKQSPAKGRSSIKSRPISQQNGGTSGSASKKRKISANDKLKTPQTNKKVRRSKK